MVNKILSEIKNQKIISLFKNRKFQYALTIILLLTILFLGFFIRIQNLPLLIDQTTGEKIPLALDPFYFLRIAETKLIQGGLPEYDYLRKPFDVLWSPEILPDSSILIYKIGKLFDDNFTIIYAHILNPVIFFLLSLLVYFLLVNKLTKSKTAALISSLFLALIPIYLYRTMSGFADHDSIGMFSLLLLLLVFTLSLRYLEDNFNKNDKKTLAKKYAYSILIGFLIALTIACWGGIAKFSFMIIPFAIFIYWLIKRKQKNIKELKHIILFYIGILLSSIIFAQLISGRFYLDIIKAYIFIPSGLISLFIFGFLIVDFLMIYLNIKKIIKVKEEYEIFYSFSILVILGLLVLFVTGNLDLITGVFEKILKPFGSGRLDETVAENQAPSFEDWKNQTGPILFWVFIIGLFFIGADIAKNISQKIRRKAIFLFFWIFMVLGVILSSHSSLDSFNFLKKAIYFLALGSFFIYLIWIYIKEKEIKINPELIIIFSWMLFMLIAARGAVRLFFVITPFVCFAAGLAPIKALEYSKKYKDEIIRLIFIILFIAIIISLLISFLNNYNASLVQAENTGPSANYQWQKAMSWVRNNTNPGDVFVHWWDYGYWVEYLGERPTISDGGHFQGVKKDHMIGRYVLTNENPNSAYSFMKSNNISYLLIDQTDLGKYSAYSRIGSGPDMKDKFSWIPVMAIDERQTQETSNKTIRIYQGGSAIDKDITYNLDGKIIFLPQEKSAIIGIIITTEEKNGATKVEQPTGVFYYNNQQIKIPLRYLYYNGQFIDFQSGLNSTAMIITKIIQNSNEISYDPAGALIYLSEKTSGSLFARLYLMNDPLNQYPTLELAHSEQDYYIEYLESQGLNIGEFAYFGGFRGPIKIWNVTSYPENIIAHQEFAEKDPYGETWEYGMLDELKFIE